MKQRRMESGSKQFGCAWKVECKATPETPLDHVKRLPSVERSLRICFDLQRFGSSTLLRQRESVRQTTESVLSFVGSFRSLALGSCQRLEWRSEHGQCAGLTVMLTWRCMSVFALSISTLPQL